MNAKLIDRLRSRVINSTGEIDREAQKIFTPGQVYVTPSHYPPPLHQHPQPDFRDGLHFEETISIL